MGEWRDLAEHLVELDLAIEDLDSWATETEDVARLERLENLRDDLGAAIVHQRISGRLRKRLELHRSPSGMTRTFAPYD